MSQVNHSNNYMEYNYKTLNQSVSQLSSLNIWVPARYIDEGYVIHACSLLKALRVSNTRARELDTLKAMCDNKQY